MLSEASDSWKDSKDEEKTGRRRHPRQRRLWGYLWKRKHGDWEWREAGCSYRIVLAWNQQTASYFSSKDGFIGISRELQLGVEKAMAPHSSTLAWKIPWTEEPGRLQSMRSLRVRLSDFAFTFHFHTLEKEMATHSSVLAWRISGTGEPGGLPSMGSHRVRHHWSDLAAAAAAVRGLWLHANPCMEGRKSHL